MKLPLPFALAICILFLVAIIFATSCASLPSLNASSIRALNERANDPCLTQEQRMHAVFELFHTYIKPGFTSREVHAVLTDTRWLNKSKIHLFTVLAGEIPIELTDKDSTYSLVLFPASDKDNWVVYFRLSGGSMRPESQALGFLKGEMDFGDNVRVVEFALWNRKSLERFGSHNRPEVKVFKGI